jgi:hypothetical protein
MPELSLPDAVPGLDGLNLPLSNLWRSLLPDPQTTTFHVHLFPVIRLMVSDVIAATPQEAIQLAQAAMPAGRLDTCLRPMGGEWAEEFSHFLVDVAGDEEFSQSRFFYSRDDPAVSVLQAILAWHDGDRSEHELSEVICQVRKHLDLTV